MMRAVARAAAPSGLTASRAGRLSRGVMLVAMGVSAAIGAATTGLLVSERTGMREDATQRALGLADAAAATVFRATETVLALSRLSAAMMRAGARGDAWAKGALEVELREHLRLPTALAVQVAHVGPDGRTTWSNLQDVHQPVDLRDREHIRVHLDGRTTGLFVSVPVLGRISNRWTVQFSERVDDAAGRLVGIVVVSVETDSLASLLNALTRNGESIALARDIDGKVIARTGAQATTAPEPSGLPGVPEVANPMRAIALTAGARLAWGQPAEALHALPGMPLMAIVQVATETRAAFLRANLATVTTGVTAICVVLALAALLMTSWRAAVKAVEDEAAFQTLERSTARFRQLAEHVADLVMIHDGSGGLAYVSPSSQGVTGIAASALTEAEFIGAILGAEGEAMARALREAAGDTPSRIGPFRFGRPDGSVVWLETVLIAIADGAGERIVVSSTRNVTETVEARVAVQRLNAELSLLLAHSPVQLYRVAVEDGADLGAAAPEPIASLGGPVPGSGQGSGQGSRLALALAAPHPAEVTMRRRARLEALTNGEAMADYRVSDGQGGWRMVRDHVRRADGLGTGARPALVGALSDISHERALAIKLAQAAKLVSLGEMATGLAHELNQPLATIGLVVENLRAEFDRGEASRDSIAPRLSRIEVQIERAVALVERMRVFGRIPREAEQAFSLTPLAEEVIGRQRHRLEDGGITARITIDPEVERLRGPRIAVEQVLMSLVVNAIEAVSGATVSGGAAGRTPAVSVAATLRDGAVTIEVDDNGPGIHPDVLPKIFDPFFTTKMDDGHQGLGLAISYGLVSDLGGTIGAVKTPTGARFRVTLPGTGRVRVAAEARDAAGPAA